jgi:hypothetical protein
MELADSFPGNCGILFADRLGKLRAVVAHDSAAGAASVLASTSALLVLNTDLQRARPPRRVRLEGCDTGTRLPNGATHLRGIWFRAQDAM